METTEVSTTSSSTFHVVDSSSISLYGDVVVESESAGVDIMSTVETPAVVSTSEVVDTAIVTSSSDVISSTVVATSVSSSQVVNSSSGTTAPLMNVLTIPPATKDSGAKVVKPIYLIPNRTGGLALATTSTAGTNTVNKVLLTSGSSSLGGKPLIVTKSLADGKGIPIVMKGQYIGNTAVTGATTGGHIITKVILTSQTLTGQSNTQTVSLAPVNSVGTSMVSTASPNTLITNLAHPLKFVAAPATQSQTRTVGLTTSGVSSPMKPQIATTVPASPSKQAIMVSKIALSPKAPTKIMIPVNMGKSPQKIAPAPLGVTTAQLMPKSALLNTVVSVSSGTVTGTSIQKLNTVMGSPTKVIIKQPAVTNVETKPITASTIVSSTVNSPSSATVKHVVTSSGTTLGVQPIQVPGSKLSYIRLVTAAPSSTSVTGAKTSSVEVTRAIAPASLSSTQVKIALPLATTTSGQLINRPIMASKPVTGQRFLIPTSSLSGVTGIRPSAGSITVPASALAQLPPGTTLYSSSGNLSNIVMLPAQYVTQLQAQATQSQTIVAAAAATVTTSSRTPIVIAPSIQTNVDGISAVQQTFATAVTVSSSSASSQDKSISHSSRHGVNGKPTTNDTNGVRLRKPCNCTKSQCLKLYCDCFANGEFCHNCNCNNCSNNLEYEEERQKAIKSCLERNPQAFHPKIVMRLEGKGKGEADVERRHNKGCNCKRSGCLKNYCECYEAKIMCSYMCKCVGCKNFAESAEKKTLMHLADAAEVRVQQQTAAKSKLSSQMQDVSSKQTFGPVSGERLPSSFITSEVVEATCQCLLAQAEDGKINHLPENVIEQLVIQEFGRCLLQVIEYANRTKS